MMSKDKKGEYIGLIGTVAFHALLVAILLLISFAVPAKDDEDGGLAVMMGDVEMAQDGAADNSLVDVDVLTEPEASVPAPAEVKETPMITQEVEKTVAIEASKTKTEKTAVKTTEKTTAKTKTELAATVKKTEKSEAEIAAEKKRLAEEKAEAERKAAAEATAKKVSGAFGKGSSMSNSSGTADSGTGKQGSKDGNSGTGASTGVGTGSGTFSLGGRSLGEGGLPKPVYNVQEEGTVVVTIVVNPAGKVIDANINLKDTKTMSSALRKAALDAAKKARFNEVSGVNNQTGSITYYFKLK